MKADSTTTKRSKRRPVTSVADEDGTDSLVDRGLDQGVEFLTKHGFAGEQIRHLFSLDTRQQKFLYMASVAGATVAVTYFSQSLVGRTLKRVPFLRWA